MLSTLSKFRVLARMIYPVYSDFEEWVVKNENKSFYAHIEEFPWTVTVGYDGAYNVYIGNVQLIPMKLNRFQPIYRATYVFWQSERYAKGNESLFAPKRSES